MRDTMINRRYRARTPLPALLLAGLLSACGVSNVVVEGSFPTPNVTPLPLRIGVLYEDALREHAYIEYSESGNEEYNVATGATHIRLFDTVLPAMFAEVVEVKSLEEAAGQGVDAVFIPVIDEFQLALPGKTKLDVYEVWIKYNMRLLTPEGGSIADWVTTSYGKTQTEALRSGDYAINAATVVALRDLASSFSLRFAFVPEVRDWLNSMARGGPGNGAGGSGGASGPNNSASGPDNEAN